MQHIFMKYKHSQTFCVLQYSHKPCSAIRNCLNNLYGKYGVLNYTSAKIIRKYSSTIHSHMHVSEDHSTVSNRLYTLVFCEFDVEHATANYISFATVIISSLECE